MENETLCNSSVSIANDVFSTNH